MSAQNLATDAAIQAGAIPGPQKDTVLGALTKFIPTETITLYISAVAATGLVQSSPDLSTDWFTPKAVFWFCLGFTPLVVYLLYVRQLRLSGREFQSCLRPSWKLSWRMVAASISFIVWALAVPNNAIVTGPGWSAIVGVAALFVSSILNLLEDAVSPSPSQSGELAVQSALYGNSPVWKDVTNSVRSLVHDGRLSLTVTNALSLSGDPCPNQKKQLIIHYWYRGETRKIEAAENSDVNLP